MPTSLPEGVSNQAKKPKTGYICKRCNSDQHFFKDCPLAGSKGKYVCYICNEPGHHIRDCPSKQANRVDTSVPSACWFCLSNPAIRKHLIMSIGENLYVTLAKGGLIPEHFIIIPIEHHSSTAALTAELQDELLGTIKKFETGLGMQVAVFAHRHNAAHHLHFQVVALPENNQLATFASSFAEKKGYKLTALSELNLCNDNHEFIFWMTGAGKHVLHIPIESGNYFPANFGRELCAEFLGVTDRLDWKRSPLSDDEERQLVETFKSKIEF